MTTGGMTKNLGIPLASHGLVEFKASYVAAMEILAAVTGLTLPVVTAGVVPLRVNMMSNLAKIASAKGLVLPVPQVGLVGMRAAYVTAMTAFDALSDAAPPKFSDKPAISPTSGDTGTTYSAADPTLSNGTITVRQWLLGTAVVGTGTTIIPGAGYAGQLTRKVTGTGIDGSTITTTSSAVTVSAVVVPVAISGTPGPATQNATYSFTPTTTNGGGSKVFALTGTLPVGLSFSKTTGAITGTPTVAGTASGLNITVTDNSGSASLGTFSIVVAAAQTASPFFGSSTSTWDNMNPTFGATG